jgi:hypothetical protein
MAGDITKAEVKDFVEAAHSDLPKVQRLLSSYAKESRYFVPTWARISVTLWQSVSKFW